jgi:glucose/arabinose dehydrogenase
MLQATTRTLAAAFTFFLTISTLPLLSYAQGNECSGAASLTSVTSCTVPTSGNPNYTLNNATASAGIPAGCSAGTHYDVWFSFAAASTTETVTIGNFGSKITNPEVQIFSGTCGGTFTSQACGTTTATATGLTISATYFIRVSNVGSDPSGTGQTPKFDLCLVHPPPPPANDDCSGAISLTPAVSCSNIAGTLISATATAGLPAGCESVGTHYDVWYKFVAASTTHTVTISGQVFANPEIQLYSGTCGSLTSVQCGTTSLTSTTLTVGNTYYVRVSNIGSSPASNGGFNICVTQPAPPVIVTAGRMNEVYKQTILSDAGVLNYPWEITYGPDNKLWVTESRGYKVYRMDPSTGAKTTVLDISQGSTFLPSPSDSLNVQFSSAQNPWPQGGLAGLAIHPKFLDGSGLYDFVYVSYVHRYLGGAAPTGRFFRNKLVRFTYNTVTGKLESPAVLCDTLPGSNDHNSQRIIIAPVTPGGTNYLFYAQGDMGAGQFDNRDRPEKAQIPASYEGKILRFNLVPDGDAGAAAWIPNDNPYSATSAVYCIGFRNNQGFAYDTSLNILYGSSHGPYSDDEINIIEPFRNYGHPLIEGFVDGNYNGTTTAGLNTSVSAGAPYTDNTGISSCPPIGNETANKAAIDASGNGLYKEPLFSAYPAPLGDVLTPGTIAYIWKNNPGNALPAPGWPTEAWSGLDLYSNKIVPGWKRSLVAASLKWGRLVRLKLGAAGTTTLPNNNVNDTISYFGSQNRFRDLAFSPDGKDIFVVLDNSSTTSGPGAANPVVPLCAGCVQKYTFLGYADAGGKSTIPAAIDVTAGTANSCATGTTITIDNTNNTYWVPITGPDGNIMAEIYANGNNLGTVTSSFYTNSGAIRVKNGTRYLDRNITITPQTQPSSTVKIRLYLSKAEYDALDLDALSGVSAITDVKILKNTDACGSAIVSATTLITPTFAEAHGTNGYMLQGNINSFSSFYFASSNIALPLNLLTFTGSLQNNATLLQWETANEINTSHFVVERSTDGIDFKQIGSVLAKGNGSSTNGYSYTDYDVINQPSPVVYYRLKIVDIDGSSNYSKIISITLTSLYNLFIYPNPVHDVLKIKLSLSKAENLHIQVIDINGRIVYKKSKFVAAGAGEFEINVKNWPAQIYSVKIVDSNNGVLVMKNVTKL